MTIKSLVWMVMLLIGFQSCKNNADFLALTNPKPETNSVAQSIDGYLSYLESLGFSGAIVVGHNDGQILSKGYGMADRERRIPYTPETVQSNGSNTKQFTGAAILLLESQNKLSLKDSLPIYFDNVPKDKEQITIHQLLTHSSGLILGVGSDDEPTDFELFFEKLMSEPLRFESGTTYNYSNAGYSILGRIVEKASGKNYETFIRENLLEPSGMMNTGYVLPNWKSEDLAIGYSKGEKWGKVYKRGWIDDGPNWHLRANGGLHTTVEDMYKWFKNVQGDGVLSQDAIEKWTKGYMTENNGYSKYGYGLVTYEDEKWGKVISHSGSNSYFTSHFFWLPERDFFFYIHGNNYLFPTYNLEKKILEAAFDKDFIFPPKINTDFLGSGKYVKQKEGTYISEQGKIDLMADGPRFIAKFSGQETLDLMYRHSDAQKQKLTEITTITKSIMEKIENGEEDAFKNYVPDDKDSKTVTESFHNGITQMRRPLESINVIGTYINTPSSRLYEYGAYTTFVHARFENWNRYWNIVWDEDGKYVGNYSGPWPEITFVPVGKSHYKGLRATPPWISIEVEFQKDCFFADNKKFCLSENRDK